MLITFTGAHSTGKSTLLQACKEIEMLKAYTFVNEVTRKIQKEHNVSINDSAANYDYTQTLILADHIKNASLSNAVLDRCILDGYLYTQYLYLQNKVSSYISDFSLQTYFEIFKKYDIVFYTDPTDLTLVEDGVRSKSIIFRDEMIKMFEQEMNFLEKYAPIAASRNFTLVRLKGTVDERVQQIKETLTKKIYDTTG